ncbi:hypothetical protein EJ04DRAFT_426805 [Polyplosphaeria fusca]|uniref:cAMP-independent regulatory protein pac2 n=1 Tax=Polyplosphaeria fusca TaxID=682080 RepID=A0A9P4V667_9PLEO|nr:hypothetical protein EJ04DRAFT_426805 [Polyplosphaeria fusca]
METYHGHVRTPADAIILFEACRIGLLPRVQRRLSEKERQSITSGSVFVWDEREAGMRRWTDGKSWSASRVSGSFLTYREMEGKRGANSAPPPPKKSPDGSATGESEEGEIDGYRYKVDGLLKQSFSITTASQQHLHLISYIARHDSNSTNLSHPSSDSSLRHIRPPKNMYPESTVNETSTTPPVTRGPMTGSPFTPAPHQIPPSPPYSRPGTTPTFFGQPAFPMPPHGAPQVQYCVGVPAVGYQPVYFGPQYHHPHAAGLMGSVQHPLHTPHHAPAFVGHPPYGHPGYGAPPARHPMPHEIPPQPPQANARHTSLPEQGPQLPALNVNASAPARPEQKPPTPPTSDPKPQEPLPATTSERPAPEGAPLPARTIPSVGALLNSHPSDANTSNSRSGSRSPSNTQRPPAEIPIDRFNKNSTHHTDTNALNKLTAGFLSTPTRT